MPEVKGGVIVSDIRNRMIEALRSAPDDATAGDLIEIANRVVVPAEPQDEGVVAVAGMQCFIKVEAHPDGYHWLQLGLGSDGKRWQWSYVLTCSSWVHVYRDVTDEAVGP